MYSYNEKVKNQTESYPKVGYAVLICDTVLKLFQEDKKKYDRYHELIDNERCGDAWQWNVSDIRRAMKMDLLNEIREEAHRIKKQSECIELLNANAADIGGFLLEFLVGEITGNDEFRDEGIKKIESFGINLDCLWRNGIRDPEEKRIDEFILLLARNYPDYISQIKVGESMAENQKGNEKTPESE